MGLKDNGQKTLLILSQTRTGSVNWGGFLELLENSGNNLGTHRENLQGDTPKEGLPTTTAHTVSVYVRTCARARTHTRGLGLSSREVKPQLPRAGILHTNHCVTMNQPAEPRPEFGTVCRDWSMAQLS